MPFKCPIQIITAPSILGLTPSGVQNLADAFLRLGLAAKVKAALPVYEVTTLNSSYSTVRDAATNCLNPAAIREFSVDLGQAVSGTVSKKHFALTLGGDCSILIGIMSGLKTAGNYGLVFLDAHADFYLPHQSVTGQVADMDLAIVTGRGPELLTGINNNKPYVQDGNVVHIAQREWEETRQYGSQDIKKTDIKCFDLAALRQKGIVAAADEITAHLESLKVDGFWIHFDTDVLDDALNPAVDYRLPGGLTFAEAEHLLKHLLNTGKIAGMSITIYNPSLDKDDSIAVKITDMLGRILSR